jgi:hypothetical protein
MSRTLAVILAVSASIGPAVPQGRLVAQPLRDAACEGAAVHSRITFPSNSKLFVVLDSPIAVRAAKEGEPVYFHTISPLAEKNGFIVPINSFGQGALLIEVAPSGHAKHSKAVRLSMTSLVLPTGDTLFLRGSSRWIGVNKSRGQFSMVKAGDTAIAVATVGAVAGLGKGAIWGAGAGGLFGLAVGFFSHHAPAEIPRGTLLEISVEPGQVFDGNTLLENSEGADALQKPQDVPEYAAARTSPRPECSPASGAQGNNR